MCMILCTCVPAVGVHACVCIICIAQQYKCQGHYPKVNNSGYIVYYYDIIMCASVHALIFVSMIPYSGKLSKEKTFTSFTIL